MVFHLQKTNQKIFHPSENRRNLIPENPPPPAPLGMNPPEGFYDIGDEDSHTTKKGTTHLAVPLILILHSVNNNHISLDQVVQLPAELAVF